MKWFNVFGKFLPFALLSVSLFLSWNVASAASDEVTNSVGVKFKLIPSGSFTMGADLNIESGEDYETPQRRITISKPFYMGIYEVTQAEWTIVMGGANPSKFKGRTLPVEQVSWDDSRSFIRKLNQKEGTEKYRLPTEAEWEYCARAGTTSAYFFGDDNGSLGTYAWLDSNSGDKTHPSGEKEPNPWGLYDIYGNVYEWVQDYWGDYSDAPATDPSGPWIGLYRVVRSCGWDSASIYCRSAFRFRGPSDLRFGDLGLRLAFTAGD